MNRVVVKLGSQAITHVEGGANLENLREIVSDIADLMKSGIEVVLISSGAIQTARGISKILGATLREQQALSAIGQPELIHHYRVLLQEHELTCGQVLLTHEDFKVRTRYLNAKNTIQVLLENKVLPILNENDSVSFSEIALGDNDQLAAMTAQMMQADRLLMLTGPDGLFDKDPSDSSAVQIKKIAYGERPQVSTKGKSKAGRGGMGTKLLAVKKVTPLGIPVVLASYKFPNCVKRAFTSNAGTLFEGNPESKHNLKDAWLLSTVKHKAWISIDEGAYRALLKGASLLPAGIIKSFGGFRRGDCIEIKFQRKTIGVGVVEYSEKETNFIHGLTSEEIKEKLGFLPAKVLIHRDNLVLKEKK